MYLSTHIPIIYFCIHTATYSICQLIMSRPQGLKMCCDSRDIDGNTLLHHSASCGNGAVVRLILQCQKNIRETIGIELFKNLEGKTPAHLAAESNHDRYAKMLSLLVLDPLSFCIVLYVSCDE